jgi:DNA-binding MarR family transcriptional regulator
MQTKRDASVQQAMTPVDYALLAEFRHQLRLFLRSSEDAARKAGLEPQQHQLLLAVKAAPTDAAVSIGSLSERLQLRPHSVSELIDRLEQRHLVQRRRSTDDGRVVLVVLTRAGERVLERLSRHHLALLQSTSGLSAALERLARRSPRS